MQTLSEYLKKLIQKICKKFYKPSKIYLTTEVTKQWRSPPNNIPEPCYSRTKRSCFEL